MRKLALTAALAASTMSTASANDEDGDWDIDIIEDPEGVYWSVRLGEDPLHKYYGTRDILVGTDFRNGSSLAWMRAVSKTDESHFKMLFEIQCKERMGRMKEMTIFEGEDVRSIEAPGPWLNLNIENSSLGKAFYDWTCFGNLPE